jgi:hypothetical protein
MPYNPIGYAMTKFLSIFLMWGCEGLAAHGSEHSMGRPLLRMAYTFHLPESMCRERLLLADSVEKVGFPETLEY